MLGGCKRRLGAGRGRQQGFTLALLLHSPPRCLPPQTTQGGSMMCMCLESRMHSLPACKHSLPVALTHCEALIQPGLASSGAGAQQPAAIAGQRRRHHVADGLLGPQLRPVHLMRPLRLLQGGTACVEEVAGLRAGGQCWQGATLSPACTAASRACSSRSASSSKRSQGRQVVVPCTEHSGWTSTQRRVVGQRAGRQTSGRRVGMRAGQQAGRQAGGPAGRQARG